MSSQVTRTKSPNSGLPQMVEMSVTSHTEDKSSTPNGKELKQSKYLKKVKEWSQPSAIDKRLMSMAHERRRAEVTNLKEYVKEQCQIIHAQKQQILALQQQLAQNRQSQIKRDSEMQETEILIDEMRADNERMDNWIQTKRDEYSHREQEHRKFKRMAERELELARDTCQDVLQHSQKRQNELQLAKHQLEDVERQLIDKQDEIDQLKSVMQCKETNHKTLVTEIDSMILNIKRKRSMSPCSNRFKDKSSRKASVVEVPELK